MAALLAILCAASLAVGATYISPADIFSISLTESEARILLVSRVPRLVSLILAGAGLALAGQVMQQLTRNRFVSPTTAGTLDSARLGIVVSMVLFPSAGALMKMALAFAFALGGTYFFMHILGRIKFNDPIIVPLAGLMFSGIIGSATTFFAYKFDLIQAVGAWLLGNFALVMKGRYELLYIIAPASALIFVFAGRFTVAGFGEDVAKGLGLGYRRTVNAGLAIVALITAAVVITVGMIPFLGLIVPNIISIYRGDNLRHTLLPTAMLGSALVLGCDLLSRLVIHPYEIPINLTVGVVGSAVFAYLLARRHAYG